MLEGNLMPCKRPEATVPRYIAIDVNVPNPGLIMALIMRDEFCMRERSVMLNMLQEEN